MIHNNKTTVRNVLSPVHTALKYCHEHRG